MITTNRIQLDGTWHCCLDRDDSGLNAGWFKESLDSWNQELGTPLESVTLPGTLAENSIGNLRQYDTSLTKENVQCLRADYDYKGVAWYERTIDISQVEDGEGLTLFFERVMVESTLWVNGRYVGTCNSLSTPHVYTMDKLQLESESGADSGQVRITIRIDNRDIAGIGEYASAYTDETQSIWNGIVGAMYMEPKSTIGVNNYRVWADNSEDKGYVRISLSDDPNEAKVDRRYSFRIYSVESEDILWQESGDVQGDVLDIEVPLGDGIRRWSEYEAECYRFGLDIEDEKEGILLHDERVSGFCCLETVGREIRVNGLRTFFRGNIDCCLYPLTGYPPMDWDSWYKVMKTTQNYGYNHIRFHSWCPPEIAFQVADHLGIYLQVEGPIWLDNWMPIQVGGRKEQYTYLPQEAEAIVRTYGFHPSFCIFSNGNELNGDFSLLETMVDAAKAVNPTLLYMLTTNWDRELRDQDDVFIAQKAKDIGLRGQFFLEEMADTTGLQFDEGVAQWDIPVMSHEIGQYVTYPDVTTNHKYTGVLQPVNFEAIKADLAAKGLLEDVPAFVRASGKLAHELYKAECEAALATKEMAGMQILSLHDFPGQSTATVGLIDVFFDSKGLLTEEEFKECNDETVMLLQLPKKIYSAGEPVEGDLKIAHYGRNPLQHQQVEILIKDLSGESVYEETMSVDTINRGVVECGKVLQGFDTSALKGRHPLTVTVRMNARTNTWPIWVYGQSDAKLHKLQVVHQWDASTKEALRRGETVVLTPDAKSYQQGMATNYFPVFWSPVHFESTDLCGMVIRNSHPLFADYYPSKDYADYEWKAFLEKGCAINLDALPDYKPMTQVVPNFFNNHKASPLFEMQVGAGKLLVCGYDFDGQEDKPQTQALKEALVTYIASEAFCPDYVCDEKTLDQLLATVD